MVVGVFSRRSVCNLQDYMYFGEYFLPDVHICMYVHKCVCIGVGGLSMHPVCATKEKHEVLVKLHCQHLPSFGVHGLHYT